MTLEIEFKIQGQYLMVIEVDLMTPEIHATVVDQAIPNKEKACCVILMTQGPGHMILRGCRMRGWTQASEVHLTSRREAQGM